MPKKRTVKKLAKAIVAALDPTYDLVYVQQGDRLTDKQVDALVSGDWETLWEESAEWEGDNRADAIESVIKEVSTEVIRQWELEDDRAYDDLRDKFLDSQRAIEVGDTIADLDSSTWAQELANATPDVLLRITAIEEDDAFSFQPVTPQQVLAKLGWEDDDDDNRDQIANVLANASPEFSVLMGYWVVGANVREMLDLPGDIDEVEITNPYLYLGNPVMGHGYVSDEPLIGVVKVKRSDLHTDKSAYGYSIDSIFGGVNASSFRASITPVLKAGTAE